MGNKAHRYISLFAICFGCLFFTACGLNHPTKNKIDSFLSEELSLAAKEASSYLVKNCRDDGSFVYRNYLDKKIKKDKYNILRHAGAIYSLISYYKIFPDKNVKKTIMKASDYLQQSIQSIDKNKLAIFSHSSESKIYGDSQAKLGGAGLSLIAFSLLQTIDANAIDSSILDGLAEFIVFMQNSDGSFASKYIRGLGKDSKLNSLYYPGEAMYGLMLRYESDKNIRWFNAAVCGMLYLAKTRKRSSIYPPDHWALLATERILEHWDDDKELTNEKRSLILSHACEVGKILKNGQILASKNNSLVGSFMLDSRVCPSATRVEGLLALANTKGIGKKYREEILKNIDAGVRFLLCSQIKTGQYCGGFPRAVMTKNENTRTAFIFNRRVNEIRIDYVQHSLSAIIGYYQLKNKSLMIGKK